MCSGYGGKPCPAARALKKMMDAKKKPAGGKKPAPMPFMKKKG